MSSRIELKPLLGKNKLIVNSNFVKNCGASYFKLRYARKFLVAKFKLTNNR